MCSTPFGIRGFIISRRAGKAYPSRRAQRLSASEGSSCRQVNQPHTPGPGVLNAFRHQRVHHRHSPVVRGRVSCAQRLSASEGSSFEEATQIQDGGLCSTPFGIRGFIMAVMRPPVWQVARAQRLSASEGSSFNSLDFPLVLQYVLNAFRHQRVHHRPPGKASTGRDLRRAISGTRSSRVAQQASASPPFVFDSRKCRSVQDIAVSDSESSISRYRFSCEGTAWS